MINKALSLPRLFKRLAFVEQFEFLGKEGENFDQPTTTMEILTHTNSLRVIIGIPLQIW